ncbi:hypothetical protein NQ314_011053 [Rhamnusium bicolor]|uniref:Endonuclease/exonuclease/phosphatase domain-containing protein n=1 Tax=Rhamnusium bicolor TaxID=1586634 RepID=A0AAV8XM54_9CUCU|nr:hypothetical protein NQ314_011053 [Rhamnusium bicolor]
MDKKGVNDMQILYGALCNLKEAIYTQGRTNVRVAIATPEEIDRGYVRKLLECVFRKSGIKVGYLMPGNTMRGQERRQPKQQVRPKNQPEETVTIKVKGKTFSELLKTVKQGVDIKKIGVNIKKIRKSGSGDLMLTVEGTGKASTLKDEIATSIKDAEVRTRKPELTLFIYGMDGATTEEEVAGAIKEEAGVQDDQFKIASMRKGRFENQTATIVNLMRSRASHDIAYATAMNREVDIIIASEPNKKLVSKNRWIKDKRGDVAVLFTNKKLEVHMVRSEEGSPNISLDQFKRDVDVVMNDSRGRPGESIILGDLNVKSPQWGSAVTDARGGYIIEWMATLDMTVKNTGITPTFSRGNCESFIDVTFSTQRIAAKIVRWEVLEEESLSDHRFIYFEVEGTTRNRGYEGKTVIRNDWEVFRTIVEWTTEGMEINKSETTAETCTRVLKDAYTDSQIRRCRGRRAEVPYWWNTEIEVQRTKCLEKRRQLTRANRNNGGRANSAELNEEYRRCKRELRNLIDRSKRKHWRELCDDLENDIWGNGYRIAMGRLANQMPTQLSTERKKEIAEKLAAGLMRIMPNIGGPSSGKREILCGVVHSTILYGAPIWCEALRIRRYRTMLEGVQRRMLLRVGSAYRTTSTVALQVITGVIPIDLMVEERRYLYEMGNGQELAIRKAARERILNLWQRRWELNEEKGQWTKRLIPDLRPWVTCRHRRIDFYISQFLTGHGSFGTYTQRLGISENAFCVYCGEEDSPEHTVLYCHRWAPYRIAIYGELGFQLTAETLVAHMIEDKRQGNTIVPFVHCGDLLGYDPMACI